METPIEDQSIARPWNLMFSLLFALILVMAACSSDTTDTTSVPDADTGEEVAVVIDNFTFTPGSTALSVGDSVVWTNDQAASHTTTAVNSEWDSGQIKVGSQFGFTFTEAGTFDYFCSIHPAMTGTVVVSESS
jgi:plastocyanin